MANKFFPNKKLGEFDEGPIETGQTNGMAIEAVIERYLSNRNEILSMLRIYSNLSISDLANKLDTTEKELKNIESGGDMVPFQWVPKIAKIFNVDLKMLLSILGHVKNNDILDNKNENDSFLMAAQYSGPELSTQEKVDLRALFNMILDNLKNKKTV